MENLRSIFKQASYCPEVWTNKIFLLKFLTCSILTGKQVSESLTIIVKEHAGSLESTKEV